MKIKEQLAKCIKEELLPSGLDINVSNVEFDTYEYENKYDDYEKCSNIVFDAIYKNEPFKVVFYHGIGHKCGVTRDKALVLRQREFEDGGDYETVSLLSPEVYYLEQPLAVTEQQSIGNELASLINIHCFDDDESLYAENTYFIEEVVNSLMNIKYFIVDEKIDKEKISLKDIRNFKVIANKLQEIYKRKEGAKLLQEMLEAEDAPVLFKEFVTKYKITEIGFEKDVLSADYMPDFGHFIIFKNEMFEYKFLFESSETYFEFVEREEGELKFLNEEELSNFMFEKISEKYESEKDMFEDVSLFFNFVTNTFWVTQGFTRELF